MLTTRLLDFGPNVLELKLGRSHVTRSIQHQQRQQQEGKHRTNKNNQQEEAKTHTHTFATTATEETCQQQEQLHVHKVTQKHPIPPLLDLLFWWLEILLFPFNGGEKW